MPAEPKVVAILTATTAFSSILHMILSARGELRVRLFENEAALSLYMHIAPVDLLVCDYDDSEAGAAQLVPRLRSKAAIARKDFQVIAMSKVITPAMKAECIRAGIDEVVVKPMSPRYLEERVLMRLSEGSRHIGLTGVPSPRKGPQPAWRDVHAHIRNFEPTNVVSIFDARRPANEHA